MQRDPIELAAIKVCVGVKPHRLLGSTTTPEQYWDALSPDAKELYRQTFLDAMATYHAACELESRAAEETASHRAAADPEPF